MTSLLLLPLPNNSCTKVPNVISCDLITKALRTLLLHNSGIVANMTYIQTMDHHHHLSQLYFPKPNSLCNDPLGIDWTKIHSWESFIPNKEQFYQQDIGKCPSSIRYWDSKKFLHGDPGQHHYPSGRLKHCFFKWAIPGLFLVYFRSFSNKIFTVI